LIRPAIATSSTPVAQRALEGGHAHEGQRGQRHQAEHVEAGAQPGQLAGERQRDQPAGDRRQVEPGPAVGLAIPTEPAVCNTKCSVVTKVTTAGECCSWTSGCDIICTRFR